MPHRGRKSTNRAQFTHVEHRPLYIRLGRMLWRPIHYLFRYPQLSNYTPNPTVHKLPTAYMLLEYIDNRKGQMLSNTWDKWREDPDRCTRLHKEIARIILSLARDPQPRIGAFHFQDDCTVALSNRPLTCATIMLENDGTPRTIQKGETYSSTEPYVSDMLALHDNYFLSNPNSVYDAEDCRGQMAARTVLRAVSHHYMRREYRNGPFIIQFSDFHASNIFVDEDWNITCLIDLEWVCALPREMLAVPYWLTGCSIDGLRDDDLDEFNKVRQEFMLHFEEQERDMALGLNFSVTQVMNEMWESKGVWFWHCLDSINAMLSVPSDHIYPLFSSPVSPKVEETLSRFWRENSEFVVEKKVADERQYDAELRRAFGEGVG